MLNKILYVRSGPYQIDLKSYNSQEIGLAVAFAKKNIECDILYYHRKKNFDQKIEKNGYEITIFWRKGIKLLRSGIYPQILNREFLEQYNAVIISEYSQIMAVLLSRIHNNVYIYNGPYYNLFKFSFMESIYDKLFCGFLDRNTKMIFCKTQMAKDYLVKKGFKKCEVVGVGLDIEKFEQETFIDVDTKSLISQMEGHRNLLYVGSISKRKNVGWLIDVFNQIKKIERYADVQFVIIGKDENDYLKECKLRIEKQTEDSIVYKPFLKNTQLKFIYEKADIFLLSSVLEIFGMVLLEAMYFGISVISSGNAGARTLIENGISGIIVEEFSTDKWIAEIIELIDDRGYRFSMGKAASEKIRNEFMWDKIVDKILRGIKI